MTKRVYVQNGEVVVEQRFATFVAAAEALGLTPHFEQAEAIVEAIEAKGEFEVE